MPSLTYDNNGNLQTITDSSGTTTYTWNARNQLTGISGPGVSATFLYDGLGRREKKAINSNVTEFFYDGLNPVQETSGATVLANILPGLGIDEFLTRTDVVAGVTSSFLTDALGSPVAVTDNAGVVQTEYTYEPFGKTTFTGASNSSSYQYTGRENDGTGLYYYRARFYHSQLQRFVSEDPIQFGGGDVNFYSYASNSPLVYNDPDGKYIRALRGLIREYGPKLLGEGAQELAERLTGVTPLGWDLLNPEELGPTQAEEDHMIRTHGRPLVEPGKCLTCPPPVDLSNPDQPKLTLPSPSSSKKTKSVK